MKKLLLGLVVALVPVVAWAGRAHFVGDPLIVIQGDQIVVSAKVAGLGDVPQIDAEFTALAECVNPGGNKPSASNKESLAVGGVFPVQNGKALILLTLVAAFQPPCDPPMSVVFSDLHLTVTAADGTSLTFP
jgi:hypothetical protein